MSDAAAAQAHFDAGDSLLIDDVGASLRDLDEIGALLCRSLGIEGRSCAVKLSVSPTGSGLFLHFDQHDSIQVQLSGTKRWSLSLVPAVRSPLDPHAFGAEPGEELRSYWDDYGLGPPTLDEVVLGLGDSLTVPRGYWHETRAEAPSVGLIICLAVPPWLDLLLDRHRRDALTHVAWREPMYGAWQGSHVRETARSHVRELIRRTFDGDFSVLRGDLIEVWTS